ncbi:MAG: putative two-component sensor protein [Jatrophihabitans sp.]|nr:putative two-component sensor protein [Jatrophihabitans sp.]
MTRPWTLRRRLGRSFVALAVLLAILGTVVVGSTVKFALAGNDVIYRWQPAAAASQRLLADLVNQETGVRGYLLTRQPTSLQPYVSYKAAQATHMAQVKGVTAGDSTILAKVQAFATAALTWQHDIAEPAIALVEEGKHPDIAVIDAGSREFGQVRTAAADLTASLVARATASRRARTLDGVVAAISLGLAIVLIATAGIALWRGLHRWVLGPVERLGTQTRDVASGDLTREIVPDGPLELTALGADVEGMRARIVAQLAQVEEAKEEFRLLGEELERSNADLQQFAYVASHDLSEPLRKVTNFCQLLERQYGPQLDNRAREYIDFAVDGAKRMQNLINDLLELSRVGRTTDEFAPVDTGAALDQALSTLSDRIADSGATVDRLSELPTVLGDRTLLTSLLENLVGNAVKYHRDDVAPVVEISAEHDPARELWRFTVSDNGIGIDPQYAERIFAVFQRLHLRDQYGGTGIGLALARKIVEFHGGEIWLDTVQSPPGATLRFTLPEGGPSVRPSH